MDKVIFHIDIDAFYASVEQNDHPEYRHQPVVVGALPGNRGVVSTCSYEARLYGIHSAMPISSAYRKCPNAIFLPVRMERYHDVSEKVMSILKEYTPDFQQVSVDEAFLDMTGTSRLFGPPEEVAKTIKKRIHNETGLIVSIGIGSNHFISKLASDYSKPDGLKIVSPQESKFFIEKLPLKRLWGVGEKTLQRLEEFNIQTTSQLKEIPLTLLKKMMGNSAGEYLHKAAHGEDPGVYRKEQKSRSISSERTMGKDTRDKDFLKRCFLELSQEITFRILNSEYSSSLVFIKIRYDDFSTHTAQKHYSGYFNASEELFSKAWELFLEKWDSSRAIRLIGLGLGKLEKSGTPIQQELFSQEDDKQKKMELAVFKIKKKINRNVITKASLLNKGNRKRE